MNCATFSMKATLIGCLALLVVLPVQGAAKAIHMAPLGSDATGDGSSDNPYRTLKKCSTISAPGDSIIIHYGTYPAETSFIGFSTLFRGTAERYITVIGRPEDVAAGNKPVFDAGGLSESCFSVTALYNNEDRDDPADDVAFIVFQDIVFRNSTVMGINIDDGGENSRHSPAHHIVIQSCEFYDINPAHIQGSGIKMAGVDTFSIQNCVFRGIGHNGIDFVGCHQGIVRECEFTDNLNRDDGLGVQCKGGSRNITIDRCLFRDLFLYGVSLGQSTSPEFFRPPCGELDGDGEPMDYEAKNCNVTRCLFINVGTPIRWSCARGGKVYHNTMYCPKNDYLRDDGEPGGIRHVVTIHQDHEYCDGSYALAKCRDGEFKNNVAYFGYTDYPVWVQSSNTEPETFVFSNNLWYCWVDESNSIPDWSYLESVYGSPQHFNDIAGNPLFASSTPVRPSEFRPSEFGPASQAGLLLDIVYDYLNKPFASPPTIGAFESIIVPGTVPIPPQGIGISPR